MQNLASGLLFSICIYFIFREILDRLLTKFSGKPSWRLSCILWFQLLLSVVKAYKWEQFQRSFSSRYLLKRKAKMQPENTGGEIPPCIRIMSMGKLTYYGSWSSGFWIMGFLWSGDFLVERGMETFVLWGVLRVNWTPWRTERNRNSPLLFVFFFCTILLHVSVKKHRKPFYFQSRFSTDEDLSAVMKSIFFTNIKDCCINWFICL